MYLIKPSFEILNFNCNLSLIELAGRTCYKSECKGEPEKFVKMVCNRNHESVLEHSYISVKFIIDRGVSHELVRHRLCAFSQESTRYCDYNKKGITFIIPPWFDFEEGKYSMECWYGEHDFYKDDKEINIKFKSNEWYWLMAIAYSEDYYNNLISNGQQPQQSRSVLPNSLKTEIVCSANAREWRHILTLRCDKSAHPQMREIMIPLLKEFQQRVPVLFDNIKVDNE